MSALLTVEQVKNPEEVQEIVRNASKVLPIGRGTKPALTRAAPGTLAVDLRGLSGIVEYEPAEYTITALAGTPVADLVEALRQNGQYLPFDPVLVDAGSTVGGMVASGLSGSGRLRYGGIRDFILGTRFVDGHGRLIRGGGKVVKNAAGFDFPKLLVGSMGRLGIMVDATFKVFPRPTSHATVLAEYDSLDVALTDMQQLSVSSIELIAMDLIGAAGQERYTLATRIGGTAELLSARAEGLQALLPNSTVLVGQEEATIWSDASEFAWADTPAAFVKIPLSPSSIPGVEDSLGKAQPARRYAVAGNVLWLPWSEQLSSLNELLIGMGLGGVVLRGETAHPQIGATNDSTFARRVKSAIDPDNVFQTVHPV